MIFANLDEVPLEDNSRNGTRRPRESVLQKFPRRFHFGIEKIGLNELLDFE